MTVSVIPLGSEHEAAHCYAEDLIRALRDLGVECSPSATDIVHSIASDWPSAGAYAAAHGTGRTHQQAVLTVLTEPAADAESVRYVSSAYAHVLHLTDASRDQAVALGQDDSRAEVVPWAAPDPDQTPSPSASAPPSLALLVPRCADPRICEQAIAMLAELGRGTHLTIAQAVGTPRSVSAESIAGACRTFRVADRVQTVECHTDDELRAVVRGAAVVIASAPECAGMWNALVAPACARGLVAPDTTLFRDLMLRAGCVRLVRPEQSGHMASCVRALLANPLGLSELAERGYRYAKDHSWHSVAARVLRLYQEVLTRQNTASTATGDSQ
jgi:glycosyltransferase involved in cell wall biosynthesis